MFIAPKTLAKIVYDSPAWWGFTSAADRQRLEAFVAKSKKLHLYADSAPSIAAICNKADDTLFRQIITNPAHVLHYLLPPAKTHAHNLRPRRHNLTLPSVLSTPKALNLLSRQLFKDSY